MGFVVYAEGRLPDAAYDELLPGDYEDDMPSKSKKQAKTMRAAAHNPQFAKKVGIPVKVAKDFEKADEKRKTRRKP